jgi:hypothetical protein
VQKVRDAERERQYEEYKDRVGEIVNGLVKRVEYGNVIVDLGRAEAMLRRDEMIPREHFKYGDRVRAYIYDVRREQRGRRSSCRAPTRRVHGEAVRAGGAGNLRRRHRDPRRRPRPGSRAKIAVISHDSSIDPVGACVGMRGCARAGRGRRASGRKDRHHPVDRGHGELRRQRAGPGRGDQGRYRRGHGTPSRSSSPTISCRWRSAGAARTCAWPRS